ncbi:transposase family protein [Streptomyces tendae]|uniref:transposase family protein n=1 Tax=Streptomyces tendae TaxID=1932 RepID=UPI003646C639
MNQFAPGKVAVLVAPSVPSALHLPQAASGASRSEVVVPPRLLDALARVPDPRNPRGVRFRLATLLEVGVCALTSAGHNSLTAIAEWVRRCDQDVLARLGCPFDPFTGRFRAPGERTLRDVFARVDPAVLTAAGFARLSTLQARPVSVDGLLFPHARQVVRIHRKRRRVGTSKWRAETVYAVTDLAAHQASPAEIAAWARGHWIIENAVHWTKDVTFAEDSSQIRIRCDRGPRPPPEWEPTGIGGAGPGHACDGTPGPGAVAARRPADTRMVP